MAFALSPEREKQLAEIITRYPTARAAALPALWLCQRQNGWVSPDVIDFVARRLELSTAIIKGIVTFYTMFHEEPVAPNVVWVCRTLSCDLRGGKVVQEHMEKRFGCHPGGTSKDGKFTLLKAECLAACGQAPMVQINDDYYEDLTIEKLDRILDEIAAKTATKTGARTITEPGREYQEDVQGSPRAMAARPGGVRAEGAGGPRSNESQEQ